MGWMKKIRVERGWKTWMGNGPTQVDPWVTKMGSRIVGFVSHHEIRLWPLGFVFLRLCLNRGIWGCWFLDLGPLDLNSVSNLLFWLLISDFNCCWWILIFGFLDLGCLFSSFLGENGEISHATVSVTHWSFWGNFFVLELITSPEWWTSKF